MADEHGVPGAQMSTGQGAPPAPVQQDDKGLDWYKNAYENQLLPEYTRSRQELAEAQESLSGFQGLFAALTDPDPEVRAAAFEAVGLQEAGLPESQAAQHVQEEWIDPLEEKVEELTKQLDTLRSAQEQEAAAKADAELDDLRDQYIGAAISQIEAARAEQEAGFKFTENEEIALGNMAIGMADDDEVPDVMGAYELLYGNDGFLETNRSRWLDTKQSDVPPLGHTISADQRPKTARERIAYVDERMAQMERQR